MQSGTAKHCYSLILLQIPLQSNGALLYMVCDHVCALCEAAALTFASQGRLRRWRSVQGATAPCAAKAAIPP